MLVNDTVNVLIGSCRSVFIILFSSNYRTNKLSDAVLLTNQTISLADKWSIIPYRYEMTSDYFFGISKNDWRCSTPPAANLERCTFECSENKISRLFQLLLNVIILCTKSHRFLNELLYIYATIVSKRSLFTRFPSVVSEGFRRCAMISKGGV